MGVGSLNCLGSSQLSGLALLLPLQSALSSFLQAKCQFCVHCQEALKSRKKVAQMTLRVESVPKSRVPGNTTGSAKDSTDFLNKRGSTAMSIVSDMKHKKILDISKHLFSVSVGNPTSMNPNI